MSSLTAALLLTDNENASDGTSERHFIADVNSESLIDTPTYNGILLPQPQYCISDEIPPTLSETTTLPAKYHNKRNGYSH